MRRVKVLICGSSRPWRQMMHIRLAKVTRETHVVGEAETMTGALRLIREREPQLVILVDSATNEEVAALRRAIPEQPHIVIVPEMPLPDATITQRTTVLPRKLYSQRAMTAVLDRVVAHL